VAKRPTLEQQLAALNDLRDDPYCEVAREQLRKVLAGKSSFLVAKAATMAREFELAALLPLLPTAFDRFMTNPLKTDKGCKAKTAIADALFHLGYNDDDVFLRGIRHVQLEPGYGGRADTAPDLRGACALGLVATNYPDTMTELAHLLADAEPPARIAAARAIAYSGQGPAGVPVLRYKSLIGDDHPQVVCECFAALLKLAPDASLPFVTDFLDRADVQVSEAAAMAIGESRLDPAFDILKQWSDRIVDPARRRTALVAIAMLRYDRAIDFLLSLIVDAPQTVASDAIVALAMHRYDDRFRQRVEAAAAQREDIDLRPSITEAFDGEDQ